MKYPNRRFSRLMAVDFLMVIAAIESKSRLPECETWPLFFIVDWIVRQAGEFVEERGAVEKVDNGRNYQVSWSIVQRMAR
jgi:hypothetical protein